MEEILGTAQSNEMFKTVREFYESIKSMGLDIDEKLIDLCCYEDSIYNNSVFGASEVMYISISKILGYESFHMNNGRSLVSNYSTFFDYSPSADGYHSRSNSMTEIPFDEIVQKLAPSFESEPMETLEINGNYFISYNGLHRFTTLKMAYLAELQNGKTREELDKKYTIPVQNRNMDRLKTSCSMLLRMLGSRTTIYGEMKMYGNQYRSTGKSEVIINNESFIMDDNELLSYTLSQLDILKESSRYDDIVLGIGQSCGALDSWGSVIDNPDTLKYKILKEYMPSVIEEIEKSQNLGGGIKW